MVNAQIRVELEPEQIPGQNRWPKQTVELAPARLLRLKNVTQIHAQVRNYDIVNAYPLLL